MSAERLHHAVDKLKDIGIRMTPQRNAILSYLLKTITHPTADEIFKGNRSTVSQYECSHCL